MLQRLRLGAAVLVALSFAACSDNAPSKITGQDPRTTVANTDRAGDALPSMQSGSQIVWGPAPDVLPPGAQFAVLQGDPGTVGALFTIRLRFPNGYILPPHFHPSDEIVTVIGGEFLVGMGEDFAKLALTPFRAGDYGVMPSNMAHFAMAHGITEVQVHGIGPFALRYVHPGDDPRPPLP